MPAQEILQPNPPADASLISDSIFELAVKLDTKDYLSKDELNAVQTFRRAADYIAAGECFLFVLKFWLMAFQL